MKVAVVGAGGIGAVIAASAVGAGSDVTVCVRTPIDELVIDADGTRRSLPVTLVAEPSALTDGPFEVVWLTVKANDTASAAPWLAALCGADTVVAVVQNGLDHVARVSPYLTTGRAVPVIAYIAAERLEAGVVRHISGNRLVVPSEDLDLLGSASGGMDVRPTSDMLKATWTKLLNNIVANPLTALTLKRVGVIRQPGLTELARGLVTETVAVARAEGADIDESMIEKVVASTASYGDVAGSSMLYDRMAGRPMEHQYLTGEVVRRGAAQRIPTPLNSAILALLDGIDNPIPAPSP